MTFAERRQQARQATSEQQFDAAFDQLGRYTSGFSAPNTGQEVAQVKRPQAMPTMNPLQKAGAIASQTADAFGDLIGATGRFIKNTTVDAAGDLYGIGKTLVDLPSHIMKNEQLEARSQDLDRKQQALQSAWKAGRISASDYKQAIDDITKAFADVNEEAKTIYNDTDPWERAEDLVSSAVTILSFGSWGLAKAGGKQALQAGLIGTGTKTGGKNVVKNTLTRVGTRAIDKNALTSLTNEIATPLEKLILKVPSARSLIERNLTAAAKREAQKVAGENAVQFMTREGKNIAVDFLVKRPVFYQTNIADATEIHNKILQGDFPDVLKTTAWMSTQLINGGPIGVVSGAGSWMTRKMGKLSYGTGSVIDELSKEIGNKKANQIAKYLTRIQGTKNFDEAHNTYRILQEVNLRVAREDAKEAARLILQHYTENGISPKNITPARLAMDMGNWAKAESIAQKMLRSGLVSGVSPGDAKKYVVVRWDNMAKRGLALALENGKTVEDKLAILEELANRPGNGWGNNEILMSRLRKVVSTSDNVPLAIKGITTASTQLEGVPKKIAQELNKLGYTIARPARNRKTPLVDIADTRKLISAAENGNTELFDPAIESQPVLASIAGFFERTGLSPRESRTAATNKLSESITSSLDELGLTRTIGHDTKKSVAMGGRVILSKLQDFTEQKAGIFGLGKSAITDIRQLTVGEVAQALSISISDAKQVSRAVVKGYMDTPIAMRGAGDWVVDRLYALPHQKHYARIQSAFRYTYNPFFRLQERVETGLLSRGQANNLIWNKSRSQLDDAARLLDEAEIFSSSLSGAAAQDQVIGRITANITKWQKRDLAGLAMDMAATRGISLEQLILEHADEVDDALRVVVQYPRQGVLASPLARTMNLMFFPMRYNLKVTQLAAKVLERQPPSVQLAVIHSGFKMRDWLKSDEGILWQSEHADAIQLFSWITPVNSIAYTFNVLNGKPDSIAELGQLGGLPLGFITQILDGQGVIDLNRPYVNPKDGEVFPDYIPQTLKAQASVALLDLMGTMFTYPGRILGMPGKEASIRKFVDDFVIDTNSSDYLKDLDEDKLTPLQKNWVRVLKGDTSSEAIDELYNAPTANEFQWYTMPPLSTPLDKPVIEDDSSARSAKRKKTARPIPTGQ